MTLSLSFMSESFTLSHERQRVALARAVYARADILILDDVLNALDARTKKAVAENLLGKDGLLKKLRSTVVLVTHECKYLFFCRRHFRRCLPLVTH